MQQDAETRLREFAKLVASMRDAQRDYFRTKSAAALDRAKRMEKAVDRRLKEIFDEQQPWLFGDEAYA